MLVADPAVGSRSRSAMWVEPMKKSGGSPSLHKLAAGLGESWVSWLVGCCRFETETPLLGGGDEDGEDGGNWRGELLRFHGCCGQGSWRLEEGMVGGRSDFSLQREGLATNLNREGGESSSLLFEDQGEGGGFFFSRLRAAEVTERDRGGLRLS
uniref:Uncharacterized protein n=1 Tax=Populus davidiana TaxID=266767 RepID=A0A6M2EMI7_9ROSI